MKFNPPLAKATLLRRYQRFLADVELPSGKRTTIHCPNTGTMTHCLVPGSDCWYSTSNNPKRKYPCTWEIATTVTGHLAGINTGRANGLVREAIEQGAIAELSGYRQLTPEARYGRENSRIDFLLTDDHRVDCYLEVKSVTWGLEDGRGLFPDAVSARAAKHLRELMHITANGQRAVLCFCVQHTGIRSLSPADALDPVYGATLREAITCGVEVIAYRAEVGPDSIQIKAPLPVVVS